jgi:outer membrane protein assembly factor BamD
MYTSQKLFIPCAALCAILLWSGCGLKRKKYENPISKDTLQPDKVLFDRAINDIEHGRYEVARLTLNTLINTYDSSEYLAKAKLAIADSWYREGGPHGLAQAEAEYKDFELFYPNMEESAESQWRVCQIHYKQMEKVDRDNTQALRAEDECTQMVTAYPNSRYTKQATQMLRSVQEVLAAKEFRTGAFYYNKGAFPAAEARLSFVAQQFPLFSGADDALWMEADSFKRMGDRFENQQAAALSKIVQNYPLSDHVDEAKEQLTAMKKPIPPADPAAYERMKYDRENTRNPSLFSRATDILTRGPDAHLAAKSGAPSLTLMAPPTPLSVPAVAPDAAPGGSGIGGTNDVTAATVTDTKEIDTRPEARTAVGGAAAAGAAAPGTPGTASTATGAASPTTPAATAAAAPPPTNHPFVETKKQRKLRMKQLEKQQKQTPAEKDAAAAKDVTTLPKDGAVAPASNIPTPPSPNGTPAIPQ